jgi:hypothetical protein
VLEFSLPSSCLFFLHFLPPCNIFLHLWLFFAIGSIHQEAQAVKFNCSCTSGLLRLQLSSTNFQVQLLAYFRTSQASIVFYQLSSSNVTVLPDYSGYNCILPYFQVQRWFFFGVFYLIINIYLLSLSNSLSTKYLKKFLIIKIAILSFKSSNLIATSTFLASISRLFSELPTFINNFKPNYFYIKFQISPQHH